MSISTFFKNKIVFGIAVLCLLGFSSLQISAQTAAGFSGNATGVIADANVVGGTAVVGAKLAETGNLPSVGGRLTGGVNGSATLDLDGPALGIANLTTGIVRTRTSGGPAGVPQDNDLGATLNSSQSQAVVNNLNLNIAAVAGVSSELTVTASTITATTKCVCGPDCTGTSVIEGLSINGLLVGSTALPFTTVAGTVTLNADGTLSATPNSQITVTIGTTTVTLFLNEQISPPAVGAADNITVNALRIQVSIPGVVTSTNIIVAQAYSDIVCQRATDNTSSVTVNKDVCNRIGQSNTCSGGPDNSLNGQTINFTVTPTGGQTVGIIPVVIEKNANGVTTLGGFGPGEVLVCEVVPQGFMSTPRPNSSGGGTNQSQVGTNCILAVLETGNNVFKFLNSRLAPTAASASVSGRVLNKHGRSAGKFAVFLFNTDTLETRVAYTNKLGIYRFDDLMVGHTYVLTVRGKGFKYAPQTFTLAEDKVVNLIGR